MRVSSITDAGSWFTIVGFQEPTAHVRLCFIGSGHAVNLTEKYRLTAVFFYCIVGIKMGRNGSAGKVFQKNFQIIFPVSANLNSKGIL